MTDGYPVQLEVDYPDRPLNRLTTFFRAFTIIPIAIVLGTVSGAQAWSYDANGATDTTTTLVVGAGGILIAGPLLMILFRQKYPRWWFDWNLELTRFSSRVALTAPCSMTATRRPTSLSLSASRCRTQTRGSSSIAGCRS
jgi:hypothetical protein